MAYKWVGGVGFGSAQWLACITPVNRSGVNQKNQNGENVFFLFIHNTIHS